jgi:hypothetical protein
MNGNNQKITGSLPSLANKLAIHASAVCYTQEEQAQA